MIMKKEKGEASSSTKEIAALAPEAPESSVSLKGVIELLDDESEDLGASIAAVASASPSEAGPSIPWAAAVLNTSGD